MPRPRKPKHIKEAAGTLAPSREVQNPLKLRNVDGLPAPPKELGRDGKKYWTYVCSHLYDIGELKQAYLSSILVAAKWYQVLSDAFADIKENGYVYSTGKAKVKRTSTSFNVADRAAAHLEKFERDYGLTLVSSQKIEGKNQTDEFFDD